MPCGVGERIAICAVLVGRESSTDGAVVPHGSRANRHLAFLTLPTPPLRYNLAAPTREEGDEVESATHSDNSATNHLNGDGTLNIKTWAEPGDRKGRIQTIQVDLSAREVSLPHSPATGEGLVSNGQIGIDVIRVGAGKGFQPHTHPGDHVLIVVGGEGTITYDGVVYPTQPGDLYIINGEVPHAVGARTDHVILAVGSPHRSVNANDRMLPLEYKEVLSTIGSLSCLICNVASSFPQLLHDQDCSHCPCPNCTRGM